LLRYGADDVAFGCCTAVAADSPTDVAWLVAMWPGCGDSVYGGTGEEENWGYWRHSTKKNNNKNVQL